MAQTSFGLGFICVCICLWMIFISPPQSRIGMILFGVVASFVGIFGAIGVQAVKLLSAASTFFAQF